jgi:Ca2+-binding EF-hand superfamily protein
METIGLKLSEAEQQLFSNIFSTYDSDNCGIVSHSKAIQLLNSLQLSPQVLEQVFNQSIYKSF